VNNSLLFTLLIAGLFMLAPSNVLTRGLRNNNPLNIRENAGTDFDWEGERLTDDDPAFEEFESDAYGFRAGVRILRSYASRGVVTLDQIIATWAPSIENDTQNYLEFVAEGAGWNESSIIDAYDVEDVKKLFFFMAKMETGAEPSLDDIEEGFYLA